MKLVFTDTRDFYIPRLKGKKGGCVVSPKNNEIEVDEHDAVHLLKLKNGGKHCFESKATVQDNEVKEA